MLCFALTHHRASSRGNVSFDMSRDSEKQGFVFRSCDMLPYWVTSQYVVDIVLFGILNSLRSLFCANSTVDIRGSI